MNAMTLKQFQDQVSDLLLRHRSLLDVLSKFQQSGAAVNRSVIKSITECGCVEVNASKQPYTPDMSLEEAQESIRTHMHGHLCEHCSEVVRSEIGKHIFYLSALSNLLDVDLQETLQKESQKCTTLGLFNMS
ncbi:DUF1573 domain-containing protein [Paenibacillus sp. N1-5-1-14]|uniref:DUF1573 domain-containing protein n=1 Tax=Paenibacillus radicibacter TaxID=2972488 RepID=UPI002159A333|nr:DUF1573 domain-containing protein [Paenibacillus radicibacter]MCR8645824.1 DUF1573 domain-containing protein [Paenibacillus radicibacter]